MGGQLLATPTVATDADGPDRWAELTAPPGGRARRRARRTGRSGGTRLGRAIRPALPGVVGMAIGATVAWWRDLPWLALGLVGVAVVLVLAAVFRPGTAHLVAVAAERFGHAVGVALSTILLALVWGVLIVPVAVFNRLFGIDLLPHDPNERWRSHGPVRGAHRTWGREPRPTVPVVRRVLRMGTVVAGLVVIGLVVVDQATTVPPPPATPFGARSTSEPTGVVFHDRWATYGDVPVSRHLFPDEPWGAEVLAFQGSAAACGIPDERFGSGNADVTSEYTNVAGGRRRTLAPAGEPEYTVWAFGGSTTYGVGQRDDHTIPSELVRLAGRDGVDVRIENLGVCNDVNWAETDRFETLLRSGEGPPDLAIFLDGINDWGGGFLREQYGLLDPDVPFLGVRTVEQQAELVEDARARGYEASHDAERQIALVAEQYRQGVERSQALGDEFGVPVVHFWQPALFTMPNNAPGVPTVMNNLDIDPASAHLAGGLYRRAMEASDVGPVDLIDLYDNVTRPTVFDYGHTNEAGARIAAEAMYPHVLAALIGDAPSG